MPKKAKLITIKNIDINNIHKKYGIEDPIYNDVSLITELKRNKNPTITFLDQSKNSHLCKISSIDIYDKKYLNCFWDTFPIGNNMPIGCPVIYIPSRGVTDYVSNISKNRYIIKEYLTPLLERRSKYIEKNNFYITDKAFCSFNCAISYIEKNKGNPMYKNSKMLLYKMRTEIHNYNTHNEIIPAGDIDLLKEYGGDLPITKYREEFEHIEYVNQGIIQTRPIVRIFEEKYKL